MVADKVEVVTKSWQKGAKAVQWTCEGSPEFSIETVKKADRGTDIILYINEENAAFLEKHRLEGLLEKYCKFLPVPIEFGTRTEYETVGEGEEQKEDKR